MRQPYRKQNNQPLYINIKSDHPPTFTEHIYNSTAYRVATNSSTINIFNKAKMDYDETALKINWLYTKLNLTQNNSNIDLKKRKEKKNEEYFMVQSLPQQSCQNKCRENIFPINKETHGKIQYTE